MTKRATVTTRMRARSVKGLPGQPQAVADTAHGVDQRRLLEVDLFAQVTDVGLDDAGIAAEVVAPDVVDDLSLRHHAPGVQEQVAEQVELRPRELDRRPIAPDLVRVLVHLE